MPLPEVKDMGLIVDRGVGGAQGIWISSLTDVGILGRLLSNLADGSVQVSSVMAAANFACLVPFIPSANLPMSTAWWLNGGVVNGNIDVGIYDKDFNLLGSCGATAQSGTTAGQFQALTVPVTVKAGVPYYLALSSSSATGQFTCIDTGSSVFTRVMGLVGMSAAHPLPTLVVAAAFTQKQIPLFGLTYRTQGV